MIRFFSRIALAAALLPAAAAFAQSASPAEGPEPVNPLASYIADVDYPVEALGRRQQGTVRFRLAIDAAGNVTGCTIERSSGAPSLDAASCQLIGQRARFRPARGADGAPVPGTYASSIRWIIPKTQHEPRVEAAYLRWYNCAVGQVPRLAASKLNLQRVTRTALGNCAREETDAISAVGSELAIIPARNSIRRAIAARVAAARRGPAASTAK